MNTIKRKNIILFILFFISAFNCFSLQEPSERKSCYFHIHITKIGTYKSLSSDTNVILVELKNYSSYNIVGKLEIIVPTELQMKFIDVLNEAKNAARENGGDGLYYYGLYHKRQAIIPFVDDICGTYKYDVLRKK